MLDDFKPILFNTDPEFPFVELYFCHDIHNGSELHDTKKWAAFKKEILAEPYRFVLIIGDCFENAVTGSKSDIYTQTIPPQQQKEWFTEQLIDLRDHVISIVPGNHETNRSTKIVGLYPLYDCALLAGLGHLYRQHFAFLDIGVGSGGHGAGKQVHYFGYAVHRLRDCKAYNGSDFIEGIDFAAYGHDHQPQDKPRSRLTYDRTNKAVVQRDVEVIDSGAFLSYGGYGVEGGYRPNASKTYKLILDGKKKDIKTLGYHV